MLDAAPELVGHLFFCSESFGFDTQDDFAHFRERDLLFANYTLDFHANTR